MNPNVDQITNLVFGVSDQVRNKTDFLSNKGELHLIEGNTTLGELEAKKGPRFHWNSFSNKNIVMCSFKSSGDIQKKEGGPDSCFGKSILFSDPE